jgi:P-type E1-E2 ATPase
MIDVTIPGFGRLQLAHLVCDYNGTLAHDGVLPPEVRERVAALPARLRVHVVTGDTFGTARSSLGDLDCALVVLPAEQQGEAKLRYLEALDPARVVAIGNGRNDRLMLKAAALGIGVLGGEGSAGEALAACTVVVRDVRDALDLLVHPKRLTATLRG